MSPIGDNKIFFINFALFISLIFISNCKSMNNYFQINGNAEGTTYSIIYNDKKGRYLKTEVDALLSRIEKSLSVYDNDSLISRINRNEDVIVDDYFSDVFHRAKEIYRKTNGTFDVSAEPLFKAWGFSYSEREVMDDAKVNELKGLIGMDKIWIDNYRVVKSNPNIVLNMNSIAKGYSVDMIARYLENEGIYNYLVEIGGEIRLRGVNKNADKWTIGIDKPVYGNHTPGRNILAYLRLTDKAIATSGEYRRFYIDENGNKLSHTIDPRTGYPIKHNLRSVTVIANDAISADAYATAFMVMGMEESLKFVDESPNLESLFIYEEDILKVRYTANFKNHILKKDDDFER